MAPQALKHRASERDWLEKPNLGHREEASWRVEIVESDLSFGGRSAYGYPAKFVSVHDGLRHLHGTRAVFWRTTELRNRFARLRDDWRADTRFISSLSQISMHPAYQQIIGLGSDAVPLIIDELRDGPGHWFWALRAIVGEDHAEGAETMTEAAERWIAWYDA